PYGWDFDDAGTIAPAFTGQKQDSVPGQYDFLMREYSPVQGRWWTPDPAGLAAADPNNPQTWNRYAYADANPLGAIDPLGLLTKPCPGGVASLHRSHGVNADAEGLSGPYDPGAEDEGDLAEDGPCNGGINLNDCHTFFFFFGWCFPPSGPLPPPKVSPPPDPGGTAPGSQQKDQKKCGSGFGGGIIVGGAGNGDQGVGLGGMTGTASGGVGAFYDSKTGFSKGAFATLGGAIYDLGTVVGFPHQSRQPISLGGYFGGGLEVGVTNAHSAQQLRGPFTTWSLDAGFGPLKGSIQYSYSGHTRVLSIGPPMTGFAVGFSVSRVTTATIATSAGCH
ncbi:MAG: RHS repeat-associated core domain-containing protein, partial [Terriglobales bacterium]